MFDPVDHHIIPRSPSEGGQACQATIEEKHWGRWDPPKRHVPEFLEKDDVKRLLSWLDSMVEWGKNVRDDIIRLESSLGVAAGDPGDPPPTPWREDEEEPGGEQPE